MDKNELLASLRDAVQRGEISKAEAFDALAGAAAENRPQTEQHTADKVLRSKVSFSEAVQYVGAGIVFIGIATLVGNNWDQIGTIGRILATFGMSIVSFAAAIGMRNKPQTLRLSYVFLVISILLMPLGVFTIFDAFKIGLNTYGSAFAYELCLAAIYGAAWYGLKNRLYIIPLAVFLTFAFFTLTNWIVNADGLYGSILAKFYEYRFLVVGFSYMLLGYNYTMKRDRLFALLFYIAGIISVLGAVVALGGYQPTDIDQIIWEILAPIIMFGAIYFSIFVKHTSILVLSVLFLMGYVIKISTEYFGGSLGWPLALTIAGLLLIGVGYLTVYLNRKYINPKTT